MLCGALILLAMIFDAVDGQVARITRATSDFGAQLDSLCDLVSFGLAPAILLVKMCPQFTSLHSEAIWSIAAVFACCAALRLARFNVEMDNDDDHTMFAGLPDAGRRRRDRQLCHPFVFAAQRSRPCSRTRISSSTTGGCSGCCRFSPS